MSNELIGQIESMRRKLKELLLDLDMLESVAKLSDESNDDDFEVIGIKKVSRDGLLYTKAFYNQQRIVVRLYNPKSKILITQVETVAYKTGYINVGREHADMEYLVKVMKT